MSQGFYTFSILCVTGATHLHTATPDDLQNSEELGQMSKSENVTKILYFFYTLCDRCNTFKFEDGLRGIQILQMSASRERSEERRREGGGCIQLGSISFTWVRQPLMFDSKTIGFP